MIQTLTHITYDAVFDETNDSQKKQVDLDFLDDGEAPCDALQRMTIGEIRPQDPSDQAQGQSLNDTTPPEQGLDQDKHEEDEHHNQVQVESNDQGRDEDDGYNGEAPPQLRVCHNVQRDHPVSNIFGDIEKGVTTILRVANFYKHYSFVFSFKPFKVEDALRNSDWVISLQEDLNNFKCNEV
jgi:hypothetical protein